MPLYEYSCPDCHFTFEELVQGQRQVHCPKCQTVKVERLLSVPARPQTETAAMPMACKSEGPPCGAPWCQRG